MDQVFTLLFVAVFMMAYCLPTIVAFRRQHPNRFVIAAVNLVGGMTGFLWVMTLIWAFQRVHVSEAGSNGGESGVNLVANDPVLVAIGRDKPAQLSELKALLDAGEITAEQYEKLKAEILG